MRIWDIREPQAPREVAFYVPEANANTDPDGYMTNNVEIDNRGYILRRRPQRRRHGHPATDRMREDIADKGKLCADLGNNNDPGKARAERRAGLIGTTFQPIGACVAHALFFRDDPRDRRGIGLIRAGESDGTHADEHRLPCRVVA